MLLVQGEAFRPNQVEAKVDDTIAKFIEFVATIQSGPLEVLKKQVVEELAEFGAHLDSVADKYQATVEE